jgi:hypothetical protein
LTDLAYSENVIDVQTLEQGPHCKIDVHETAAKVQATRKARDNFKVCIIGLWGSRIRQGDGRRGSIELDEITGAWSGMGQDFGDLQGVRLHIFGETSPRKS